ncbi:MAG: MTH938/NDUFAF3 family protein [Asgard group archaeon]|nr:MTH938/NDUFAF3 family protein [Asgard group archaeon]
MKIDGTKFGSITINGQKYGHDVYLDQKGNIEKRNKKISKPYSTGHTVLGPKEIEYLLAKEPDILVIGKGQYGVLPIPQESRELLEKANIEIIEDKTPVIIPVLNDLYQKEKNVVAILHTTC